MDSENTNKVDYEAELELCSRLITALEYIVQVLEENPSRYPMLIADIVCLVHGTVAEDEDGEQVLANGLTEQIQELYKTLQALVLENEYGLGER